NTTPQCAVIITTVKDISEWSKADLSSCQNDVTVWFFGENYLRMRKLREALPSAWNYAPVGALINAIALKLRDGFTNMDGALRRAGTAPLAWHCGNIAERSPYASSFTLNACRLIALQEGLSKQGQHIVVMETTDMARTFRQGVLAMGKTTAWLTPSGAYGVRDILGAVADGAKSIVRGVRSRLGGVYGLAKRIRLVRTLRRAHPLPLDGLKSCDVLSVLWTRKDSFPSDAPTTEGPSLGRLPDVIRSAGVRVGFVSSPVYWIDDIKDIAANGVRAHDDVLLLEDTINLFDVLKAAWLSLFSFTHFKAAASIAGHDISPVLWREVWREWESWRPAYASLFACVGRYMAKNGIRPKSLLHLYENHSWEKCLRIGMRRHLPATRLVGCQQAPFSPLYINFLPTQLELRDGFIVDQLMVTGPRFQEVMSEAGFPEDAIVNIGAIRYADFLDASRGAPASPSLDRKGKVLCATGSEPNDCCELVAKVAEAAGGENPLGVLVNFHPLTDRRFRDDVMACAKSVGVSTDHVEFSDLGIQTLLDQVDAVLYSDTNSAFEAMSRGLPVIHVGRDAALDYNKVPHDHSINVRTVAEIRDALRRVATHKRDGQQVAATWAGIEEILSRVDEHAIRASFA
ncbi:MAG TPA: hypothetical protein VIN57_04885, partial [Magnetovibrio sp.]